MSCNCGNHYKATDPDTRRRLEVQCTKCKTEFIRTAHPLDFGNGPRFWCDVCDEVTEHTK